MCCSQFCRSGPPFCCAPTHGWGSYGIPDRSTRCSCHWAIVHKPLAILYTPTAVLLVMIYSYLPFFVLPMYAVLEKLPADLLAAASDLGARPAYVFRTVTLPLSLPGIVSGAILVFVPAVGEYVIPEARRQQQYDDDRRDFMG